LTEQYPNKPLYEKNVAVGHCALAALAAREQNAVVAERQISLAISIYERLEKRFADQPHFRMQLAGYRAAHAGYLETMGQISAAETELIQCESAYVLLFNDFRNEVDVHGMLTSILMQQGEFHLRQGNADLAHTAYERAIKFLSGRIAEEPKYLPHRLQLAALLRTCPIEDLRNPVRAAELEQPPREVAPVETASIDR
jgi:hypothetical protein